MKKLLIRRAGKPLNSFILCSLVLLMLIPSSLIAGQSEDYITYRGVHVEIDARYTIDTISNADFTPFEGILTARGYSSKKIWLKLEVLPSKTKEQLFIQISPNNRNLITLYEPSSDQLSKWKTIQSGNSIAWNDRPSSGKDIGFKINPKVPTTYYLSLETLGSASIDVNVFTQSEAGRNELVTIIWQLSYLIILIVVISWALHEYVLHREKLKLIFGLSHSLYIILALAITGFMAPLFPSHSFVDEFIFMTIPITTASIFYFHRLLLLERRPSKWSEILINLSVVIPFFAITIMILIDKQLGLRLNSFGALFGAIATFLAACVSDEHHIPSKKALITHYSLLLISVISHLLPILGLYDLPALTADGVLYHGLISTLIFGHFMHNRARERERTAQINETQLAIKKRENEIKDIQLKEQKMFTDMLAHELKNPLASIRFTVDTMELNADTNQKKRLDRITKAVSSMDSIVKLCVLSDRIDNQKIILERSKFEPIKTCNQVISSFEVNRVLLINKSTSPTFIDSDQVLLKVIITNLLKNALVHSPNQEVVEIRYSEYVNDIEIVFANKIRSTEKLDLNAIFEKYSQAKDDYNSNGNGLGLYIVKSLSEILCIELDASVINGEFIIKLRIPRSLPA